MSKWISCQRVLASCRSGRKRVFANRRRRSTFEVLEDRQLLASYDLTAAMAPPVNINGAIFSNAAIIPAAGSGNVDSFVRVQAGGTEQGYNTSFRPLQFNENSSPTFTRNLPLSSVPVVVMNGVTYREFLLDINQTNSTPLLSLNKVQVFTSATGNQTGYSQPPAPTATPPTLGTSTLIYDMDAGTNGLDTAAGTGNWVELNYTLQSGSGQSDMFLYVPNSLFGAGANFVTLFSRFGENNPGNDGFEEWAVRGPNAIYAISGQKWNDLDADGVKDAGEPGLQGWKIYIDADNDNTLDPGELTAITDASGNYSFTGLTAGTYTIREDLASAPAPPPGFAPWTQTFPKAGAGFEHSVTITTASITNINFGNHTEPLVGNVTGQKFSDLDADGAAHEAGEPYLNGWVIRAYADDGDGILEQAEYNAGPAATDTTHTVASIDGVYNFNSLVVGNYVIVEVLQTGWTQSFPNNGPSELAPGLSTLGETLGAQGYALAIVGNDNLTARDFGNFQQVQLGGISGQKFQDNNGDGIKNGADAGLAGWTIQLDKDANGSVDFTTITGAGGTYSFTGLAAGVYRIREAGQAGWIQTTVNPNDVTVVSGTSSTGNNFGNFQLGKISGTKFNDLDRDGVRDVGEPGLLGWTIQLDKGADGTVDATTTTDANGNYSFTGLTAGVYRIREINQAGWFQTTVNPADVTVVSGTNSTGNDFGNHKRQIIVIAPDKGNTSVPNVKIVDRETGEILNEFLVYESTFRGGVRIATGNMDGDVMGIDEIIVAPGQGRVGEVRIFTQAGVELTQFRTTPYGTSYTGGIEVAVGDVVGDGKADIVTTNSYGRTDVRLFENKFPQLDPIPNTPTKQFFAFSSSFLGGADVIVADLVPGGKAEVVVGSGPGMRATIQVYNVSGAPTIIDTILPFSSTFQGGVTLSAARVNADAIPDLIVASGLQGGSAVEIWSGVTNDAVDVRLATFTTFADTTTKNMPVHATSIDNDGDGDADVIAVVQGTNGTSNQIRSFSTTGTLLGTLNGFVGPWNIATLTGLDPNLTSGFTITLDMSGLSTNVQALFNQAKARWEQIILGDLPNANYQGRFVDDVLIAASAVSIDGVGGNLGQAAPDAFRAGSQLPYHGYVQIDTADLASLSSGELFSAILHEMGHALGIGTIWSRLGLLTGAGTPNPLFIGAQATAAYNQIFGTTATGVPVHNEGGAGSRDSHWRESLLVNELMTAIAEAPGIVTPLSRITVASLADLGYSVNLAAADPYTKPAGATNLLAQPSNGGVTSLSGTSKFYSRVDTPQVWLPMESTLPLRPTATSVQPVRRPALSAAPTRFDAKVVDAALTAAYQRGNVKQSADVFVCDETDVAEFSLFNANDQFFAQLGPSIPSTIAKIATSSK